MQGETRGGKVVGWARDAGTWSISPGWVGGRSSHVIVPQNFQGPSLGHARVPLL